MAIKVFAGWSSPRGESLDRSAVTGDVIEKSSAYSKQFIQVCKERKEVHEALEIDASAGVTYEAFSADAKARYMRTLDVTSNTVVVIVRLAKGSTAYIDTDSGVRLKEDFNGREFFEKYGDSYISSVTTGLEIIISYVFKAMTKDEKENVMASLAASGVVGGATINASFKTSIDKATSASKVAWVMKQDTFGLDGETPAVTPDNIESFATKEFPKLRANSPHVVSFEAKPYSRLLESSPERSNVMHNLDALAGTDGDPGWAAKYTRMNDVKSQITEINKIYDTYGYAGDTELLNRLDTVNASLTKVEKFLKDTGFQPAELRDFPEPPEEAYEMPRLRYRLSSGPTFGADTTAINYGMHGEVKGNVQAYSSEDVRKGLKIAFVRLDHGRWMDGITVTYRETLSGDSKEPRVRTLIHGHQSEAAMTLGSFDNGGVITSMRGVGNEAVDTLEFVVTDDAGNESRSHAGSLEKTGRVTEWSAGADEVLFGFHGKCGDWLDTVRPVIAKFSPAKWTQWRP